jgi:hypothetical protein
MGPRPSISARLSNVQTETRLFVTLCVAPWTLHRPTLNGGELCTGVEDPDGVGVGDRLPFVEPRL